MHPFLFRLLHLFMVGRHFPAGPAVGDGDLLAPEAQTGAGGVDRDVAAADDHDVSARTTALAERHPAEKIDRSMDLGKIVFAGDAKVERRMGPDGKEEGLEALGAQRLEIDVFAEPGVEGELDPQLFDLGDLAVDDVLRQAIARDTDHDHAAGPGQGLDDPHRMAVQGQVVGGTQAARSGADDADLATGGGGLLRIVVASPGHRPFGGEGLEKLDRHRGVDPCPDAHQLTGPGADEAADPGQGIVAANDLDSLVVMAEGNERHIGRDVDAGRAGHLAGCRGEMVADRGGAVAVQGMAAKHLLVLGQSFLEPQTGLNAGRIVGKGTDFGHQGIDARQMIGTGPGGNDVLDQGGDFLEEAPAARMEYPAVGRDLLQFQQGLMDRALTWGHGRLSQRTRCREGKAAVNGRPHPADKGPDSPSGEKRIFTSFFLHQPGWNPPGHQNELFSNEATDSAWRFRFFSVIVCLSPNSRHWVVQAVTQAGFRPWSSRSLQ